LKIFVLYVCWGLGRILGLGKILLRARDFFYKKIVIIESTTGMGLGRGYLNPFETGLRFIYSSLSGNGVLSRIRVWGR
jgi:hypothetical protein